MLEPDSSSSCHVKGRRIPPISLLPHCWCLEIPQTSWESEGQTSRPQRLLQAILFGGDRLEVGDVPNTFGDSFTEQQLGTNLQVFRMFDEPETNDSLLPCPQLVLRERRGQSIVNRSMPTQPWTLGNPRQRGEGRMLTPSLEAPPEIHHLKYHSLRPSHYSQGTGGKGTLTFSKEIWRPGDHLSALPH